MALTRFRSRRRPPSRGTEPHAPSQFEDALGAALLFDSPDAAVLIDAQGRILARNEAARAASTPEPDPRGAPVDLAPPFWSSADERKALLSLAKEPSGARNSEVRVGGNGRAGSVYWISVGTRREEDGEPTFVAVAREVTGRTAPPGPPPGIDSATGFLLRSAFQRQLEASVEAAEKGKRPVALLSLDLDDFKTLNDTHGLSAGDEYLRQFSDLLRSHLGADALLARLGGDEFAILRPGVGAAEAGRIAEGLVDAVAQLAPVFDGRTLSVSATVGVAVFPEHASRAGDLLLVADLAMHQAKRRGRGRVQLHDPGIRERDRIGILRGQADRVRKALAEGRIVPYFQPIAEVATGRVVAVETLARLQEEDGYVAAPETFLVAAERFGLVTAIDRVVIDRAFEALSHLRRRTPTDLEMSINLSGLDFEDDELVADISRLARARGVRPERITFEITETAALRDLERVKHFTGALVSEGFRFALDDFGVGFSSFRYLRELPMSTLKFDMSYVKTLPTVMENRVFVRGIAEICRGYGVKTVAEGVESTAILGVLKELGVDRAQGFQVGRPSPDLPAPPRDRPASGAFAAMPG